MASDSQYRRNRRLRTLFGDPPAGMRWREDGVPERIPVKTRRTVARTAAEARQFFRIYAEDRVTHLHDITYNGRFMIKRRESEDGFGTVYDLFEFPRDEDGFGYSGEPFLVGTFGRRRKAVDRVMSTPWANGEYMNECVEVRAEKTARSRPSVPVEIPGYKVEYEVTPEEYAAWVKEDL